MLERVARGVYRNPKAKNEAPFEWQEIQRKFWIAIPHSAGALKRPGTKIIRMRNLKLGRRPFKIGPYRTFIFDRERCVVDSFRYLSRESAVRILREYLKTTKDRKPDLRKLSRYAKTLHVDITPYIEALT